MPVPDDPKAGQAFVLLISFLFLSIFLGGVCLVAYVVQINPPPWIPYVGVAFVCLPWLFWLFTFLYRIVSRAFGFRMVIGSIGGANNAGGGGGGGGGDIGDGNPNSNDVDAKEVSAEVASSSDDDDEVVVVPTTNVEEPTSSTISTRRVQFGETVVLGENGGGNGRAAKKSSPSDESEMPLTISTA